MATPGQLINFGPLMRVMAVDKSIRGEAARALGEIKDPKAAIPLCKALRHNDMVYRDKVRNALVSIGGNAVDPLIEALKDKNDLVRKGAVVALGEIGDPKAIEPLVNILAEESVKKYI